MQTIPNPRTTTTTQPLDILYSVQRPLNGERERVYKTMISHRFVLQCFLMDLLETTRLPTIRGVVMAVIPSRGGDKTTGR